MKPLYRLGGAQGAAVLQVFYRSPKSKTSGYAQPGKVNGEILNTERKQ